MLSSLRSWSLRPVLWVAAGAGTLALVVNAPDGADPRPSAPAAAVRESAQDLVALLRRPPLSEEVRGEPFVVQGWTRAQATPPRAQDSTPAFPFKYAGRLHDSGALKVFLARGDDVFAIERGAVYDGFRIDAISEGSIDITYVASGKSLSVLLSSLSGEPAERLATETLPVAPEARVESLGTAVASPARAPEQPHAALGLQGGFGTFPAAVGTAPIAPAQVSSGAPPAAGSMPTTSGADAPSGKLGVPPSSSGRLGTSPASSGKLGS